LDLNCLYHRRGIASYMARNAASEEARATQRALVAAYASQIAELKHRRSQPEVAA
jgi:plasmid stabilization system protein ParE